MTTSVKAMAIEVFGTPERAERRLLKPNLALDGRVPNDLLDTADGAEEVRTILGRINYGLYS